MGQFSKILHMAATLLFTTFFFLTSLDLVFLRADSRGKKYKAILSVENH